MARHSSSVTTQYVEDAWAEPPRSDLQLQDVSTLCEVASSTLARVEQVEQAVKDTEEWFNVVNEQLEKVCPSDWVVQNKAELRREGTDPGGSKLIVYLRPAVLEATHACGPRIVDGLGRI